MLRNTQFSIVRVNKIVWLTVFISISFFQVNGQAAISTYLDSIKADLQAQWPKNKTIKLIFHGHSVPAGYFKTPIINSLESYPFLLLKKLHEMYPYAMISPIVTAIGGERSDKGSLRFEEDVLLHKPDIIFIDYSLNDRRIGLESAKKSWESMIIRALDRDIKVVLLTPTPDLSEDILDDETLLARHSRQVRALAKKYDVGLVDSYALFKALAETQSIKQYMAQGNHVNGLGHDIVANEIVKWFVKN